MRKQHSYIGLFRVASPKKWEVSFPDLPGCEADGSSFKEVFENGRVALADELDELGGLRPRPRSTAELLIDAQRDPRLREALARAVMHPVDPALDNEKVVPVELIARRGMAGGASSPQAGA